MVILISLIFVFFILPQSSKKIKAQNYIICQRFFSCSNNLLGKNKINPFYVIYKYIYIYVYIYTLYSEYYPNIVRVKNRTNMVVIKFDKYFAIIMGVRQAPYG